MIHSVIYSEAGGHAVNEDAFRVTQHPRNPDCWLVALADGQGGRAGGGRASRLACDAVIEGASAATAAAKWDDYRIPLFLGLLAFTLNGKRLWLFCRRTRIRTDRDSLTIVCGNARWRSVVCVGTVTSCPVPSPRSTRDNLHLWP